MKTAEILRKLADMIDRQDATEEQPVAKSAADLIPVKVDNVDDSEKTTMLPPLQTKLELLKKASGVESEYDACLVQPDELDIIKKSAGLSPVIVSAGADDSESE
jgi:hypothetical protein